MWIFLGVILLIILILCLPIRIDVEYGERGFRVTTKLAFIKLPKRFQIDGGNSKEESDDEKSESMGDMGELKSLIKPIFKILGKFVRLFCVRKLTLSVELASEDAFLTAMMFGGAAVGVGILFPFIDNNVRIRKKYINIAANFEEKKTKAYLSAKISLLVWKYIYLKYICIPMVQVKEIIKEGK